MTVAPRARVGDRVERAIEDHADVEHVIERGEAQPTPRRRLVRRAIWLAITAVSLYLVFPSLLDLFSSWKDLAEFGAGWLGAMAALQLATLACLWALQHVAIRAQAWRPVIASQLAGNALSKIAPGGGAVGAALQYRMLVQAGMRPATIVSGLTAVNLLVFAAVLGLPVLAVPTIIRGGVDHGLVQATIVGAVVFVALFAVGAVCMAFDAPLRWIGRTIQRVRNRLRRHSEPLKGLPKRLLHERDRILETFGPKWKRALAATDRPLVLRLRDAARRAGGGRVAPAPRARPARLLRGADPGADPGHPGRAGLRRSGPHGDAEAGRGPRGRRRPGHLRLPAVLAIGFRCRSGRSASWPTAGAIRRQAEGPARSAGPAARANCARARPPGRRRTARG